MTSDEDELNELFFPKSPVSTPVNVTTSSIAESDLVFDLSNREIKSNSESDKLDVSDLSAKFKTSDQGSPYKEKLLKTESKEEMTNAIN